MDRQDASTIAGFERGLAAIPQIRHPERLLSDPDHLVRAATADLASYQALRDEKLATLPGVQRLTSTIVMKRILDDRPHPPRGPRAAPATGPSHADHPDQRGRRSIWAGRHDRPERRIREVKDPRHGRQPRPKALRARGLHASLEGGDRLGALAAGQCTDHRRLAMTLNGQAHQQVAHRREHPGRKLGRADAGA